MLNPPSIQPSLVQMYSVRRVNTDEVARLIPAASPKSLPLDCMPTQLLKATVDIMAPLLTQLANLSFTAGVFPTRYKLGHVTLLLKKPSLSKDDPANYRPFRAIHTGKPTYLACELHRHQPLRALRSGTTTLHRPHASSDFHKHSFAVSAPTTWNNIPASIRDSATLVYLQNCV